MGRPKLKGIPPRQMETLQLIADGKTDHEMGILMGITPFGAQAHVRLLMARFQVSSRALLVAEAFRRGLVQ